MVGTGHHRCQIWRFAVQVHAAHTSKNKFNSALEWSSTQVMLLFSFHQLVYFLLIMLAAVFAQNVTETTAEPTARPKLIQAPNRNPPPACRRGYMRDRGSSRCRKIWWGEVNNYKFIKINKDEVSSLVNRWQIVTDQNKHSIAFKREI